MWSALSDFYLTCSLQHSCEISIIIISILQMKELRQMEIKWPAWGHTTRKCPRSQVNSSLSDARPSLAIHSTTWLLRFSLVCLLINLFIFNIHLFEFQIPPPPTEKARNMISIMCVKSHKTYFHIGHVAKRKKSKKNKEHAFPLNFLSDTCGEE